MTRDAQWVVVVTYREWLSWTACGALRLGKGRRTSVRGLGRKPSPKAFEALMNRAPDVSRWEDQAYLVAYLRRTPPKYDGGESVELRLVTGFHPLSARGHALLIGDAERALIRLGDPVYEDRWQEWVEANRTASRETSARRLVGACGLATVKVREEPLLDVLLDPLAALSAGVDGSERTGLDRKVRHGIKLARQPAYGWWLALTMTKQRLGENAAAFTADAKAFMDRSFVEMRSVDTFTRPVTSWDAATAFAATLRERYPDEPASALTMMAVVYHYQHAIAEFGTIEYEALGEDLRFLQGESDGRGVERASLAAWCIGWHLDNATATALHCAAVPSESSPVLDLDRVPRIPAVLGQQALHDCAAANDEALPSGRSVAKRAAGK